MGVSDVGLSKSKEELDKKRSDLIAQVFSKYTYLTLHDICYMFNITLVDLRSLLKTNKRTKKLDLNRVVEDGNGNSIYLNSFFDKTIVSHLKKGSFNDDEIFYIKYGFECPSLSSPTETENKGNIAVSKEELKARYNLLLGDTSSLDFIVETDEDVEIDVGKLLESLSELQKENDKYKELSSELADLQKENAEYKEVCNGFDAVLEQAKQDKENELQKLEDIYKQKEATCEKKNNELSSKLAESQKKVTELESSLSEEKEKTTKLDNENTQLQESNDCLSTESDKLETQIKNLESDLTQEKEKVKTLRLEKQELENTNKQLDINLSKEKEKTTKLGNENQKLQESNDSLTEEKSSLTSQLEDANKKIAKLEDDNQKLQDKLDGFDGFDDLEGFEDEDPVPSSTKATAIRYTRSQKKHMKQVYVACHYNCKEAHKLLHFEGIKVSYRHLLRIVEGIKPQDKNI